MARVEISRRARQDLKDIWHYIAADNEAAADRLSAAILDKAKAYAARPAIGRQRPELGPDIRSFPHGAYVVFYSPLPDGLIIRRVLHSARDITREFPR